MYCSILRPGQFFAGVLLLLGVWTLPAASLAQEESLLSDGQKEYLAYCASCHGTDAKGTGPMGSVLTIPPPDLTQLRKNNDAQFPFWRVFRAIDGREEVRAHGVRAMPVWGSHFLLEEGGNPMNENIVIGRILSLVYYLRSIQE
jgi:mono/diheme cytochrome c family protein